MPPVAHVVPMKPLGRDTQQPAEDARQNGEDHQAGSVIDLRRLVGFRVAAVLAVERQEAAGAPCTPRS